MAALNASGPDESPPIPTAPNVFPNQAAVANDIARWCLSSDTHNHAFVYGPCQVGKTGVIMQTLFAINHLDPEFTYDRMMIVSGLNSSLWKEQTASRAKSSGLHGVTVLHNHDMQSSRLTSGITGSDKIVIVVDEMHWGSAENGVLHRLFNSFGANKKHPKFGECISFVCMSFMF
jgi:hypothetical protein